MIALCSSPSKQYPRDVEMVGEAANTLRALLIHCGNIPTENDISQISNNKKKAVTSLMKEILVKNQDSDELFSYHLEKTLLGSVDQLMSASKILYFIRVLLEVDSFLQKSLSPGDTLPWNIKDRFSLPTFVEDILIKLLAKEITYFGTIPLITDVSWQLTLNAIMLNSWDEARATSVYLRKRQSIHRIRTILQVVSSCVPLDCLNSKLSAVADLASVDFCDLWKDFPEIFVHPAGHSNVLAATEVGLIT